MVKIFDLIRKLIHRIKNSYKKSFHPAYSLGYGDTFADAEFAYHRTLIINDRIPAFESIIAKSPFHAYRYAIFIINGRFPEGEEAILDSAWKINYLTVFTTDELIKYFKINSEELLNLRLKYNDTELKRYLVNSNLRIKVNEL